MLLKLSLFICTTGEWGGGCSSSAHDLKAMTGDIIPVQKCCEEASKKPVAPLCWCPNPINNVGVKTEKT